MRAVYSLTQDLFSKEEQLYHEIEVQKMKEQFYAMLRAIKCLTGLRTVSRLSEVC